MSILHEPGNHPVDVMRRVSAVMTFVSDLLCALPPEEGLELSSESLAGLAYITMECTTALDRAASEY